LARGYLRRPALTAEKFRPDPAGTGGRVYLTGDTGYVGPDRQLRFTGRTDHQAKVRGFRVELGEIESVMLAHPAVAQAAVVVREIRAGDRAIVGFATATGPVQPQQLRAHVAASLPGHMVPALVEVVERFPVTPNGKIDRDALPTPKVRTTSSREAGGAYETYLCAVFAELLELPEVGLDDHFFELGGHSVLATRMVSRVRADTGIRLPIRAAFERPTAAGLAAVLTELAASRG
jgi:hypothetical protein